MIENSLYIGWGKRDITTLAPTCIHGQFYIRISKGTIDPIYVTALVIQNRNEHTVMISCDVTEFIPSLCRNIRQRIRQVVPAIDAAKVMFFATHTHCTGDINAEGMAMPYRDFPVDQSIQLEEPSLFRKQFINAVADAVAEAWNARKPGAIAWGYGYANTSYSRKVWYIDDYSKRSPQTAGAPGMAINGHAVMYGPTNDALFSHFEAGANPDINLLYTFDDKRRLTGAIVNVPCPSQCSESEPFLTADFWADVRQLMQQRHGDVFILPQCAPAGDLSPHKLLNNKANLRRLKLKFGEGDHYRDQRQRKDIAEQICNAFDEVLQWAVNDIRTDVTIKNYLDIVPLQQRICTKDEFDNEIILNEQLKNRTFADSGTPLERFKQDSTLAALRNRSDSFIQRCKHSWENTPFVCDIHVMTFDDIAFYSCPFELYMDFHHRIQARSPFTQTFGIQLADYDHDDEPAGYLATQRGIDGGGYSASRYCNVVSPDGGQQLVDAVINRFNSLTNP